MSSIPGGRHGHGHSHSRFSKFVSLVSGRPRVSSVGTFIYYGALISAMYRRAGGPCQGRNVCMWSVWRSGRASDWESSGTWFESGSLHCHLSHHPLRGELYLPAYRSSGQVLCHLKTARVCAGGRNTPQ